MNYLCYIQSEGEWVQVNPLGDIIFEVKREGDEIFFRKYLSGDITFIGQDYFLIKEQPVCTEIKIKFVNKNENIESWQGYFTHTMCSWDLDRCEVFLTPLPDDKYRSVLENMEVEHDFFQVTVPPDIVAQDFLTYDNDEDSPPIHIYSNVGNDLAPSWTVRADMYTLYRVIYTINETFGYTKHEEYRRDSLQMPLYHAPEIPSYGVQFIYDEAFNSDPNRPYDRWIRPYYGSYFQNFITDTGTSGQTRYTLDIQLPTPLRYKQGKRLFDCIRYIFRETPFASIQSDFFSAANPISGADLNSDGMFILQASDTKGRSDPATIFKHSWKDIAELLRNLNVYWDVDDDNNLVIEHRRYFDNGGAYGTAKILGLDATLLINKRTGKPYINAKNKYSFDMDDMPDEIYLEFLYGKTWQWDLHTIRYDTPCVKKGNVSKVKFPLLITDLEGMRTDEKAPDDGIALVNAYKDDEGAYRVRYITNPITPVNIQANGNLSMYNITRYYYMDNNSARGVLLNAVSFVAYSVKRTKVQTDLVFPYCTDIDHTKLVKTELGDGHIRSYRQDWKRNETTLTLEYEWDK